MQRRLQEAFAGGKRWIIKRWGSCVETIQSLQLKSAWARFLTASYRLRRRGGLKLKLIGTIAIVVVISILALSYLLGSLMERAITQKAYEVGEVAIERIADASYNAIMERTYANRLNLNDMLKEIRDQNGSDILDISIYAYEREEGQELYRFFSGFEREREPLSDEMLIQKLRDAPSEAVFYEPDRYQDRASIRFIRPIIFENEAQKHVIGVVVLHYNQRAITEPVQSAIHVALMTTLGVLLLAIATGWWLALRLSRPILSVTEAAKAIARGDLNTTLDIQTADEIEVLAQEFNNMTRGLREREKMQKFVSGSALDHIRDDGSEMVLGGSYRAQTLLFSDIRGFTAMSENRPPQEVVQIINFYLNLQTDIIREYGGDIDKFVGDEIMATFEGEESLLNATRAAKALQEAIATANAKREAAGEVTVAVGVGINHGEVIVGNMGSNDRMDFTSIGSAVNLAARLCSKALAGEVVMIRPLYESLGDRLKGEIKEAIDIKGFSEPIDIVAIKEIR